MSITLVIAEKPSVAQTIAAALGVKNKKDGYLEGGGYLISWCVGHLVQLSEAAAYGEQYRKWSYESLPILPEKWQYTVSKDKETQFNILKELMHRADVSEVVNACDAGREGELIFRFVYEVAGCKKPIRRLWISSMEDGAIRSGFDNLKDGREYDALFASALCRAKADWIIGINADPDVKNACRPGRGYLYIQERKILPCAACLTRRGSGKREDPRRRGSRSTESRLRSGTGGMRFRRKRKENRSSAEAL